MAILVGLACDEPQAPSYNYDARREALRQWRQDPDELLAQCARQPYEELRITCLVQAAANLGRSGDADRPYQICQGIQIPLWQEECHFRAGEELGRAGHTIPALEHCAAAGWFGRNCLMHTAWNLPRDTELRPSTATTRIETAGRELLSAVDAALQGAGDGLEGEGYDLVMARFGYNVYVGSGETNPAAAHIDGSLGAVLRTGFAIETVRLLEPQNDLVNTTNPPHRLAQVQVDDVLRIWRGEDEGPTGVPLPEDRRMGRYVTAILSPYETGNPYLPLFGGGMRLMGENPVEDMVIATLEALFWLPHTSAETFLGWVDDPRERVRWTAIRLARLTPASTIDLEEELQRISETHLDQNIRWHAENGVAHRSWIRSGPTEHSNAD